MPGPLYAGRVAVVCWWSVVELQPKVNRSTIPRPRNRLVDRLGAVAGPPAGGRRALWCLINEWVAANSYSSRTVSGTGSIEAASSEAAAGGISLRKDREILAYIE